MTHLETGFDDIRFTILADPDAGVYRDWDGMEPIYADPRPGDVKDSQADIGKARRLLGYEPGVTFEEGLRRTLEWYRHGGS